MGVLLWVMILYSARVGALELDMVAPMDDWVVALSHPSLTDLHLSLWNGMKRCELHVVGGLYMYMVQIVEHEYLVQPLFLKNCRPSHHLHLYHIPFELQKAQSI